MKENLNEVNLIDFEKEGIGKNKLNKYIRIIPIISIIIAFIIFIISIYLFIHDEGNKEIKNELNQNKDKNKVNEEENKAPIELCEIG
jgi:biopolymer transport protein ExbD